MNRKIIMLSIFSLITMSCSVLVGEIREKNGKEYVRTYSREAAGYGRVNDEGIMIEPNYLNERDKSDKIIVYSDLDDKPARHCKRQRGHSILEVDHRTGDIIRLCRLDIPGSRIEGSEIQVDEIQYYITNTETIILNDDLYEPPFTDDDTRGFAGKVQSEYSKYGKGRKTVEIRAKYLEPKEKVQEQLKELYKRKLKEQYGIE